MTEDQLKEIAAAHVAGEFKKYGVQNNSEAFDAEVTRELDRLKRAVGILNGQGWKVAPAHVEPSWWYRYDFIAINGTTAKDALDHCNLYQVERLCNFIAGPDKFGFLAPELDPTRRNEEALVFDTLEEAKAAARERREAVAVLHAEEA